MQRQPSLSARRKRLPPFHEILSFYAVIVFLVYSWTLLAFFWKVPSWRYYLGTGDILVILAYTLASKLLESMLILCIFLLAGFVLPAGWLSNKFVVHGSLVIFSFTFWVTLFDLNSVAHSLTQQDVLSFMFGFPLMATLGILLADRTPLVHKLMVFVGNQLIVFLYLWLPLSLVGILIVILRIL